MKVLDGHPEGRASVADLKHYIAILTASGADWSARMKRLAAHAPQLDIFGQHLVERYEDGWRITDLGRIFLEQLEAAPDPAPVCEPPTPVKLTLPPTPETPPTVLLARPERGRHRGRRRALGRTRRLTA